MHTPDPPPPDPTPKPSVQFDWQDWLPYLADDPSPEADKQALIEALWTIILTFVDLGFEVTGDAKPGGQSLDLSAALRAAVLHSTDTQTEEDAA